MAASQTNPSSRWSRGVIFLAFACAAVFLAHEQGWLDLEGKTGPDSQMRTLFPELGENDEDVPGPRELDGLRLASATSLPEPDELVAKPDGAIDPPRTRAGAVRHSQWSASDSPIVEWDEFDANRPSPSRIATVGFDEEAPLAPPDDDSPGSTKSKPAVVAGRPSDSNRGTSALRTGDAKAARLMDRDKIEKLMGDGDYVEAQKELSRWYWQLPGEREKLLPQLNKMAQSLYFSPQPMYYDAYVVKPGDQLRMVGQRYKLSWEYIARLNRVDAKKIRMGQKLKIVPGPFAAIIFLDRYELVVHQDGSFVKIYRVGVGKDGATPIGDFTVKNKMIDPTYYGPEGVLPHDDPNNPLGKRWIDIGDSYGIHGTIDPASIGKNESRGCIRMLNSDVEEVYDFLVIGSEVKIQK
jgi:LysM repeat protein